MLFVQGVCAVGVELSLHRTGTDGPARRFATRYVVFWIRFDINAEFFSAQPATPASTSRALERLLVVAPADHEVICIVGSRVDSPRTSDNFLLPSILYIAICRTALNYQDFSYSRLHGRANQFT